MCFFLLALEAKPVFSQSSAEIKEETRVFQTYPFDDPDQGLENYLAGFCREKIEKKKDWKWKDDDPDSLLLKELLDIIEKKD